MPAKYKTHDYICFNQIIARFWHINDRKLFSYNSDAGSFMTLFCDIMNSTLPCYYTTEGTYTDILTTKTHSKQITDFPFVLFHFVLFRFVLQITVSLSKNKEQQQNTLPLWSISFTCVRRLWRLRYNTINIILIQWHNINSKIQPFLESPALPDSSMTLKSWERYYNMQSIICYDHYILWSGIVWQCCKLGWLGGGK